MYIYHDNDKFTPEIGLFNGCVQVCMYLISHQNLISFFCFYTVCCGCLVINCNIFFFWRSYPTSCLWLCSNRTSDATRKHTQVFYWEIPSKLSNSWSVCILHPSIEKQSTNAPLYTSWVLKDFRKYRICRSQEWGHFMKVSFPGHILKVTSTVLHVSVLFIKLNYMLAPQSCIGVYYKQHDYSLPYTLTKCHFNFKLLVFFEIFPIFLFFVYCECRMD